MVGSLVHIGGPHVPPSPWQFASSDYVRVELDMEVFRMMQEGGSGWSVLMSRVSVHIPFAPNAVHTDILCRSWIRGALDTPAVS